MSSVLHIDRSTIIFVRRHIDGMDQGDKTYLESIMKSQDRMIS
jgi:hypothetical protein